MPTARRVPSYPNMPAVTPREAELLKHVCAGETTKETARSLHLSIKTVEYHRTNLMRKFGAKNIGALIRKITQSYPELCAAQIAACTLIARQVGLLSIPDIFWNTLGLL
jgi:DNA-binding CsgD family transcriptional regulator